jgi:hypothetical protein
MIEMLDVRPKRNYIRRKKCLKESESVVKSTLRLINTTLPTPRSADEIDRLAGQHAAAIEAVCWDPRTSRLTDSLYQMLMLSKTRELCIALIYQHSTTDQAAQVVAGLRSLDVLPRAAARPGLALPLPILRRPEFPTMEHASGDDAPSNMEAIGEMPRMRFDPPDLFFEADDALRRWTAE